MSTSKSSERLNARCAFASGDYAKVKQLLASAKDSEGRSLYVRALIALNDDAAAKPLARSFYIEQPAHRDVDTIQKFLEKAGPIKLTAEESMKRAEAFLAAPAHPLAGRADVEETDRGQDQAEQPRGDDPARHAVAVEHEHRHHQQRQSAGEQGKQAHADHGCLRRNRNGNGNGASGRWGMLLFVYG